MARRGSEAQGVGGRFIEAVRGFRLILLGYVWAPWLIM